MSKNHFYITTTLPYVNADPHIGFALEIIEADVIARYQRLLGKKVIFNTGTDEHGQKIYQKAQEQNIDPLTYCDQYAQKFANLKDILNLSYSHFIRTTNKDHIESAQEFWNRCLKKGDVYKAKYKIKYCVGCELEKTDSELVNDRCPLHPHLELEIRQEENYFFKFSKYQQPLLALYKTNPQYVLPKEKYKEIVSFVETGLQDFSVSRLKTKMPWGVPVPNDPDHVMYVWFDALVNYISTLGWPKQASDFEKFWPGVQLAGKDNLRQQSAMWQAMLLSAGLPNSLQILINGFISVDGQKMSKSLGNVISPQQMVDLFGTDATRYLLINLGTFAGDMDVNFEKFAIIYHADLANGLGNLCSRVAKMCEKIALKPANNKELTFEQEFIDKMANFQLTDALSWLMDKISQEDKRLATTQPWKKTANEQVVILQQSVENILLIAHHLQIFMPTVAQKIISHFQQANIVALKPLFPRLAQ